MSTVTDETGLLNNFATEPKMYLASAPSPEQKRRYLIQGGLAALLISVVTLTALGVS
ncbi:ssl1498 family light-harvesting-like protein [Leptolyngbya cf. ectocarpi LEGE 11479]|uniref:Ssl1498 family light-harvesting-like protein n=1 Tax=Leptolyngbya cf. ectocarpi LEGE 11479 TaxID=1828722 RepID=A0A928ZZJ0_LEPEC|nr:ssl1498 family light-harvesting-like protein [Leptolyngbya ectocarpi]MBE9070332.1 ssl1498 family light-harvesting-like protein [Leptolyngbya cf. ectocarpi LEGE 11479]